MYHRGSRPLLLALLTLLGSNSVLPAQSARATTKRPTRTTPLKRVPSVRDARTPALPMASMPVRPSVDDTPRSLVVNTQGSEMLVVRVPVPANVRWDGVVTRRPAQFRVSMSRHVQFVGAATGSVDLQRDSTLVLALRISRRAPAGRSLAGTVEFWVGTTSALMPIEIDVPVAHRVSLVVPTRSVVAARGQWSTLALRVQNDGNVDAAANVRATAPDGWRVDLRQPAGAASGRVVAGGTLAMTLRVWVPNAANTGIVMLPITLARPDSAPLVTQVQVDVLSEALGSTRGPTVTTSYVASQSGDARAMHGYGVSLAGQLSDSTRISGRFSYAGNAPAIGGAGFALARAGVLTTPPTIEVEHPRAQLSGGATSGAVPELAGQFLAGTGAIGKVGSSRLHLRAFDLRPMSLQRQFSLTARGVGHYTGGELGVDMGIAQAALFGATLADPVTQRQLDAYGLRTTIGNPMGSNLHSEVAYRAHAGGTGLGYLVTGRVQGLRGGAEIRVMQAPGGSRAFARASNEVQVNATRMFGKRSYFAMGGWLQDDENLALGAARSRGWYATPTFALSRVGSIGLEARGLHFSAGTDIGRLLSDELSAGGSLNVAVRGTQFTARSVLARLDRSLQVAELSTPASRQWRLDHTVLASRSSARGSLSLAWMQQQYSGVIGVLPSQQSVNVRADRLRPFVTRSVFFDAEWQRLQMGQSGSAQWLARAAVTVPLVAGASVSFGVERNPYMATAIARKAQPLLYSVRFDRATVLPRAFAGPRGFVFRDDNGNGRHDRRERGVPGVVMVCGSVRVVTDKHGRYPCNQRVQEADARTVPTGLVAARSKVRSGEELALRVVQPLVVTVQVATGDSSRVPRSAIEKLVVMAKDSAGGTWTARPTGSGQFLMDALPVGRYTVEVDAGAADEPLVLVGETPIVQVGADAQPSVTLEVRPRPLRMRTFAPVVSPSEDVRSTAPARPKAKARPKKTVKQSASRTERSR